MLSVYRGCFHASVMAKPANLGAETAMLVLSSMQITFFRALPADIGAGLKHEPYVRYINRCLTRGDLACRQTHIGAIKIEPDTISVCADGFFAEAGIRARGACLRAVKTLFDATDESAAYIAVQLWMAGNHQFNMHGGL